MTRFGFWGAVWNKDHLEVKQDHLGVYCVYLDKSAFLMGQTVKNLPANAVDQDLIPGLARSPGEGNGNQSSFLAWRIPWTEEPSGLQSLMWQRIRHD